jgi:uncharacterized protein involved in exopolysaccharide biosynthesis
MVQAHETARLDEVRDTPLLTVIDAPRAPLAPDSRQRVLRGLMGIFVGTAIGLALTWARAVQRRPELSRSHTPTSAATTHP